MDQITKEQSHASHILPHPLQQGTLVMVVTKELTCVISLMHMVKLLHLK